MRSRLFRIVGLGPLVGVLVLQLAGCGSHATVADSKSNSPSSGLTASPPSSELTASPQMEGTGPESPQQGGGGGVSVSVAPLPVGNGNPVGTSGNDQCIELDWLGGVPPSGFAVTITTVDVTAPFTLVTNCPGGASPACKGFQLSAASGDSRTCYVGVEWDPRSGATSGALSVEGTLTCLNGDKPRCQQIAGGMQKTAHDQGSTIALEAPSSSDQQQPTDTSSPQPVDTSSSQPVDTSSPQPVDTSSP